MFRYYGCSKRIRVVLLQYQMERETIISLHETLIYISIRPACLSLLQFLHNIKPSGAAWHICVCVSVEQRERERERKYLIVLVCMLRINEDK
jgi:hypothetical protein